jgi:hypothetical protein
MNIDQLVIEIHLPENDEDKYLYWGDLDIMKTIDQYFVSVNLHINNDYIVERHEQPRLYPTLAFEVTFVNRKLIKIHEETRAYAEKIKNYINVPSKPDEVMLD